MRVFLNRKGISISKTTVHKYMNKELRLHCICRRRRSSYKKGHTHKIFDNLLNNICKYGQPDTRVYLSCEKKDDYAYIYFKNTSRESLNIDPNELRERFVRGESSRNTEGNGLGLSIVESLTELQGGEFDIEIDGDLFKAILKFPIIK